MGMLKKTQMKVGMLKNGIAVQDKEGGGKVVMKEACDVISAISVPVIPFTCRKVHVALNIKT